MLEDRDYMRQPDYGPRVSFTVAILIVNAVIFIVQLIASHLSSGSEIEGRYFALSLSGIKAGYVWQLLTFQFMHASWMHLLLNSMAIFFFGRSVETAIGGGRFLALYFSSGIIGGLVQMLFALLTGEDGPVVGASAGAAGLIGAFSLMAWNERFTLILYFIPVVMRGKTLLWLSVALFVIPMFTANSGIANAAHLGGLLTGVLYVLLIVQGRLHFPQWRLPSRPASAAPRELAAKHAGKKSIWNTSKNPPDEDLSPAEYLQKEVDPILDKISAHGIQSLTVREREILEKARSRMNKR
ncbi:MAG TPA: rhomboid family intramembrane serine protease [Candidatus Acidoferrum sp.]|jgi:membrane associated rhomboid family serine protease|nr:rhomboid family intramembrane serine protease [Candidatus Acidoferrum sp.]